MKQPPAILLLLLLSVPVWGADTFLRLDGIPGESADAQHKDWIDVMSWSWSASARAQQAGMGGGLRPTTTPAEMQVTKSLDRASPQLVLAMASGRNILAAELSVVRRVPTDFELLNIKMSNVVVSYFAESAAGTASNDPPFQSFNLKYGIMKYTYSRQKPDGTQLGEECVCWNFRANRPCNCTTAVPA